MIVGVVGKANVGKSTFFKAATLAEVEIANYPFATIKPNHGMGYVKIPDVAREFDKVSNPREGFIMKKFRFVPINMIDVAGLVPGAHKGEGLGVQFLNDLNQADVLIHVIDVSGSTNEKGEPITPLSYNPSNDVKFLEEELDYWYFDILNRGFDKVKKLTQTGKEVHKILGQQMSGVGANEDMVNIIIKKLSLGEPRTWTKDDLMNLSRELRKLTKPMIIAANKIDIKGAENSFERLKKEFPEYLFVACSSEMELALREAGKNGLINYVPGEKDFVINEEEKLNEAQIKALNFMKEFLAVRTTGVQEVLNTAVFNLLKYKAIFPGGVNKLEDKDGNTLPDCFLMKEKSTALDFAFRLHTDFGKNFIKAVNVRTKMPIGKDHILENLEIVEIMAK